MSSISILAQPLATILVVDDKTENLGAMEATLNSIGEKIVTVSSGKEALKYLLDHEVAVILLDVHMPEMDGFETANLIRARQCSKSTPIIFVTAEIGSFEREVKAYEMGGVDFIIKPVLPHILKSKITIFVDLYKKTEQIKNQHEQILLIKEEQEIKELKLTLNTQKNLTGWSEGAVTAAMAGVGPIHKRSPKEFSSMEEKYENLLEAYLEAVGFGQSPPRREISNLASHIGNLGGGPRDVVELHIRSVSKKSAGVHFKRAQAYSTEGRLLAIELMGFLVDYYRSRS